MKSPQPVKSPQLLEWQRAAVGLLRGHVSRDAWSTSAATSPGIALTRHVARSWREQRVLRAARFTVAALRVHDEGALLGRWLDESRQTSMFHLVEARQFAGFVASSTRITWLAAIACFEAALLEQSMLPPGEAGEDTIIAFPGDPVAALASVLGGEAPADASAPTRVLVSGATGGGWRVLPG